MNYKILAISLIVLLCVGVVVFNYTVQKNKPKVTGGGFATVDITGEPMTYQKWIDRRNKE